MEMTIVLRYLGYPARYTISRESSGIYHAHLKAYEGPDGITPPKSLTLVRGVRGWIGSYNEPWFVAELGRALETAAGEELAPTDRPA